MSSCRFCKDPVAGDDSADHGRGPEHEACHNLDCDMPWPADPVRDAQWADYVTGGDLPAGWGAR